MRKFFVALEEFLFKGMALEELEGLRHLLVLGMVVTSFLLGFLLGGLRGGR